MPPGALLSGILLRLQAEVAFAIHTRVSPTSSFRALLPLLFLIVGCTPSRQASPPLAGRRPPPTAALQENWLQGSRTLRQQYFERLLDLVAQDPEATTLINQAVTAFKRREPGDLFRLFSLCPPDTPPDSGGHTFLDFNIAVFSLDIDSLSSGKPSAQVQLQIDDLLKAPENMRVVQKNFPDYIMIKRSMIPKICMIQDMNLASAYQTLLHELTHATLRDPHTLPGSPMSMDESTFLEKLVQAPGDELDAYRVSIRARIRLDKSRENVYPQLRRFFNDQGDLTGSRIQLARAILAPAPVGLAYASTSMSGAYKEAIETERAEFATRLKLVEATLAARKEQQRIFLENIEIYTHNVEASKQRSALARSKGDKAGAVQAQQKGEEAARDAEAARRAIPVLQASIQRLEQESASLRKLLGR